MTSRPEALISTPSENTRCDSCERLAYEERVIHGVRYEGDAVGETFAHCPECGSTDLTDDRSPWTVLLDAIRNVEATDDVLVRMGRQDVVFRVRQVAEAASPCECGECIDSSVRVRLYDATV